MTIIYFHLIILFILILLIHPLILPWSLRGTGVLAEAGGFQDLFLYRYDQVRAEREYSQKLEDFRTYFCITMHTAQVRAVREYSQKLEDEAAHWKQLLLERNRVYKLGENNFLLAKKGEIKVGGSKKEIL